MQGQTRPWWHKWLAGIVINEKFKRTMPDPNHPLGYNDFKRVKSRRQKYLTFEPNTSIFFQNSRSKSGWPDCPFNLCRFSIHFTFIWRSFCFQYHVRAKEKLGLYMTGQERTVGIGKLSPLWSFVSQRLYGGWGGGGWRGWLCPLNSSVRSGHLFLFLTLVLKISPQM